MKPFSVMIAALGLLFFAGWGLAAQGVTAPPTAGTAPPPPPATGTTPPLGETAPPPPPDGAARPAAKEAPAPRAAAPASNAPAPAPKAPASAPAPTPRQNTGNQAAAARSTGSASSRRGLYGGALAGLNTPWYVGADAFAGNIVPTASANFGGFLGWHFGKVGIEIEALMAFDNVTYADTVTITGVSLLLPLIAKYDINLGSFVIQPFLGAYYNIALGDLQVEIQGQRAGNAPYANPPLGIMTGSAFGWKFKRGMLFVDTRFAFDLGNTVYSPYGEDQKLWQKSAFTLSIGYQFN